MKGEKVLEITFDSKLDFSTHLTSITKKANIKLNVVTILHKYRSSNPEVFLLKGVLKICSKFTGEHPCSTSIKLKLQSSFIEKALRVWMFSCKFAAYFQNTFA